MATLEKIREKGVLLTIIIGGALLAFIIGGIDFTTMQQGARETVGIINDEEIKISDYEKRIDEMTTFYKIELGQSNLTEEYVEQIKTAVWTTWENEQLVGKQAAQLGIVVTEEELAEAVYGENVHPMFYSIRMFYNNQGEFDKTYLLQFLNSISQDTSGEATKYWAFIERMLKNTLLEEKYYTLVASSVNVNDVDTKYAFETRTKTTGLEFVMQPYYTIADSTITVTDKEIKERYNRDKSSYVETEESRELVVVTYDIVPTEQDVEEVKTWIERLKAEFSTSNDFVAIANQNSDIPNKDVPVSLNDVDADLKDFAFSASVGEVFGPIMINGTYKMARLVQNGIMASDSANVRHILVQENTDVATQNVADSLLNVVKQGADFAAIAKQYSKAGTKEKGGELGWIKDGDLDKEFSKAAINAKVNDIFTVKIGAGIHIVQVTAKTQPIEKVRMATIIRKVEASSRTYGILYNQASQLVAQNRTVEKFEEAAKADKGIVSRTYTLTAQEPRIANIKDSRQIIRWAYEKESGEVTDKVFECGDQFAVVALKSVNEKGSKSLDRVKETIKAELVKEKKANQIADELSKQLADKRNMSELGLPVQVAENVSFDSPFVPAMGRELKVVGNIPSLIQSQQAKVIKGNMAVFVVKAVNAGVQPQFNAQEELQLLQPKMFSQRILVESLRASAEVQDNRVRFY
ncbi:MAG: SurA N-terminal domain-containing protein [Paludibacteraceae bacterium]|nr:SurA N-terminal domain-containing protein [Paludibacteraceae bacterium]MBP6284215.1 SurA N-terminal domain-containing protein [Paludibacteraceae bacterium]